MDFNNMTNLKNMANKVKNHYMDSYTLKKKPTATGKFRFVVQIGPVAVGFSKISGLQSEVKVHTYQEGGVNGAPHYFPENVETGTLVFYKGIGNFNPLSTLFTLVKSGKIPKILGTITLLDENKKPKRMWEFHNAYPVKWIGPELDGLSNEVAVEEIHMVHAGINEIPIGIMSSGYEQAKKIIGKTF
ncbi:phage tail protein [Crassaminicella profunda]|uniref:phage tail protein n=1 Tax=Crassaminicella profunda TaxID=1286698 RepID=UPI001CA77DFF|nr:phage tail protein [Crassaminicella profunda]QZY54476.1 phage tail protein [Crassaminicella profunda]